VALAFRRLCLIASKGNVDFSTRSPNSSSLKKNLVHVWFSV